MTKFVTAITKNGQLKSDTKKSGIITNILNSFFKIIQFILQNPAKVITLGLAGQVVANSTHILAATPKNLSSAAYPERQISIAQHTTFIPTLFQRENLNAKDKRLPRIKRSEPVIVADDVVQLFLAAREGDLSIVQNLTAQGRDIIHCRDKWGDTPLHEAAEFGHLSLVQYFLEQGADIDVKGSLGRTPLHSAAEYGHLPVVQYLIEQGADIYALDNDNWTPLRYATDGEHSAIIEYLETYGADSRWEIIHRLRHFTRPSLFFTETAVTAPVATQTLNSSLNR